MKSTHLPLFIILLLTWSAQLSIAQPIHAVRVGTASYSSPVLVTAPPGDTSRLFVVEETGNIKIVDPVTGIPFPTPFMTVPHVTGAGEMGLLGFAFHPNYANNGYFYVYYNTAAVAPNPAGRMIARFHVSADPNIADPASATTIFFFASTDGIHNGGWTAFGPDGYLYVAWGNRGMSANSPLLTTPLGKILRFDVNGPDGVPGTADDDQFPADPDRNFCIPATNPFAGTGNEQTIWAYGLRNPWRDSFDRATGDLYICDVGDGTWEEINYAPAPPAAAGRNYGYPCMEGPFCQGSMTNTTCACNNASLTRPIYAYTHAVTGGANCAIQGGYVYRGCAMPWMNGQFIFGDYCSGRVWSGRNDGTALAEVTDRSTEVWGATRQGIRSFGEDARGELYICSNGPIYKLVPATVLDCNNNGVPDGCDIAQGTSQDIDHNGVPDECQNPHPCPPCSADFNHDGDVGTDSDIEAFFACLAGTCPTTPCGASADFNGDGDVGTDADIESFFRVLAGASC